MGILKAKLDICTGLEWVLVIPLTPAIIYGQLMYNHRQQREQIVAGTILLLVCGLQIILWTDLLEFTTHVISDNRPMLASLIAICWLLHTFIIARLPDKIVNKIPAAIAHLISYMSITNYVFGLPLSHTFTEFKKLIRIIHIVSCLTAILVVLSGSIMFFVIVPTYEAWGCYKSNNPATFIHGMCSSATDSTWWARRQSFNSPICSMPSRAIDIATCTPKLSIFQKYALFIHVLIIGAFTSVSLYLYGCLCAFVNPFTVDATDTKTPKLTKPTERKEKPPGVGLSFF